jgi:hypothetical protein
VVGALITLITASTLTYLVFFAEEFHSRYALTTLIVFQLSFIWTCAELLDSSADYPHDDDDRTDRTYSA